ncbi:hypothetical protein G9A89_006802 [Geosiphon pyriformis]|nr:hypothetical protein G9A89_006802 [Geosiphon pyriformis]
MICLYCGDVEVFDYVFSCPSNASACTQLVDIHASAWEAYTGFSRSSSCVIQLLSNCVSGVVVDTALCKNFVFNDWYHESVAVFKDSKVVVLTIMDFVCKFCFAFWEEVWLGCAKYRSLMKRNGLILRNGFLPFSVIGFSKLLSAGVVKLLGITVAFGISFGFCKSCLFFSDIGDMFSVHIDV